jgi:hypothetical protein
MTATKTQLIGGSFQDSEGNILVNGYLDFELNQDSSVTGVGNICSGITIRITLDSDGNVASSTSTPPATNQFIWANDVLLPANSFYSVTGFTAAGQPAWGPNNQQITSGGVGGGTYDVGTWVPNQVFSWTPPVQPVVLQTNGVDNPDQLVENLIAGTNVTLTADSNGGTTIDAAAGITLQTNGVDNTSQTVENLIAGTNITLTPDGAGGTTIDAASTIGGIAVSTATPRKGDTLRYNENADSKWDIVQGIPKSYSCYSALSTVTAAQGYSVNLTGAGTTPVATGTQASVLPTATEPVFQNSSKTASGSTSLAVGVQWPQQGGPNGSITLGTIYRWQVRCRLKNTSSVRYWIVMSDYDSTISSTLLATDTPNIPYLGFRFSAGTDSVIQAVAGTSNVLQTVTTTGVAVDTTNSQLFEIVYDGTHAYYYINGALVATIATNLPPASTGIIGSVVGDNKNTATAMSLDFAHMIFTVK